MTDQHHGQSEGGMRGVRDAAKPPIGVLVAEEILRADINVALPAPERRIDAWTPTSPGITVLREPASAGESRSHMSQGYLLNRIWADLGYHPSQARLFLQRMPDKRGRLNSLVGMNEMAKAGDLGKALVAEALGTLFITYFGCMSCIAVPPSSNPADLVLIALCFGFAVMVAVQALGHVSGANLNPAVTCGLLVTGRITIIRGVLYIIAQSIGAIAGAGMVKGLTPENAIGTLGGTSIQPTLSVPQALGIEFMLGFLLVFVVFGVIDPNKPDAKIPAPLAIGLAVAVGHLSSIDSTGSSMNPARSLGPAVIMNSWANHWVYWLGPCMGGIVAAILYHFVLSAPPQEYSQVPAENSTERSGKRQPPRVSPSGTRSKKNLPEAARRQKR